MELRPAKAFPLRYMADWGDETGARQRAPFPRWCCLTAHILRFPRFTAQPCRSSAFAVRESGGSLLSSAGVRRHDKQPKVSSESRWTAEGQAQCLLLYQPGERRLVVGWYVHVDHVIRRNRRRESGLFRR